MKLFDVAIIGAGPAGIAAALQLHRMGIAPLIFEKNQPGGLLLNANLVENYPGLINPLSGPCLVEIFKNQLANTDAQLLHSEVLSLNYFDNSFTINTSDHSYLFRTVIIASGTVARKVPDLEISDEVNSRVLSEIFPIIECSGREIVIIGAGDAAFDYALNLAQKNRVKILNRSSQTKCLNLLFDRALACVNLSYLENTRVRKVAPAAANKLLLDIQSTDETGKIECDYLITAIGRVQGFDYISKSIKSQLWILQGKGILAMAGDVKNGNLRQASIAAGEGVRAAMLIGRILQGRNI